MTNNINNLIDNIDELSVSTTYTCAPEETLPIVKCPKNFTKILTQNIRSVNRNFLNLQTLLHRIPFDCDLIVLTECWLTCSGNSTIPVLDNYHAFMTTKHINQSDGVVVYSRSDLDVVCEEPDFYQSASGLIIKINLDLAVICIYRSPSIDNINNFLTALNNILPSLSRFKSVVITGDMNVDIKPSTSDMRSHEYQNCLAFHGYLPAHTLPTRDGNCLDHTFLKTISPTHTFVLSSTITDHSSTLLCIQEKCLRRVANSFKTNIDYEGLDKSMLKLDFTSIYSIKDANMATDKLLNLMTVSISENTTVKKVSSNKRILKPWITSGLLRCIRNRDALHKKVKKFPRNEVLKITYLRYRNFCIRILRKAKRIYDTEELKKASKNPKALWDTIKRVTNTTKTKNTSSQLLTLSSSPIESCNKINSYFVSIGEKLANDIIHASSMQPLTVTQSTSDITSSSSFVLDSTDVDEIKTVINSLRSDAATGWDGISPYILKRYATSLAPILCHIFNLCFETAVFPSSLKKAIIHPVFKGGDGTLPNNYRPIAVLTALSKVLERLINKRLVSYLEHNKLLSSQQFGFRKNKSTCDAVQELTSNIVQNLNINKKVLTIFLDLAKAFDTVPVRSLLLKLEKMGVRGSQLELFQNYLTNRSQIIQINHHSSNELPIYYGVPQGSILGPTLFLVFINDLCNLNIPNAKITSFADDTAITFVANTWAELEDKAQLGFDVALNWLHTHTLTLNTSKTKFITYSINPATQPNTPISLKAHKCKLQTQVSCHCTPISPTDEIKYLGIIIDRNLKFKSHINVLTGRVRKLIYVFKTLRNIANPITIRTVYFALCLSIITYCIPCWGGAAKTLLKPLEVAHRAILKVATFRPLLYPTNQLYRNCNVLNVRQHFILQSILLQHRITPYIQITKRRKDKICTIPKTHFSFTKRFFYYLGPSLYNTINKKIPIYKLSHYNCKKAVRTFLQNKTYDETEKYFDIN